MGLQSELPPAESPVEEMVLMLLQFEQMLVLELPPWYSCLISWGSVAVARVGGGGVRRRCPWFYFSIGFYCLRFDLIIVC